MPNFLDEGESDSEEINELSRLQDPGSQYPQVGGAINEGNAGKIKPTIDNSMVPSDQNQSASDTLANISEFLKSKEGETADPGKSIQFVCYCYFTVTLIHDFGNLRGKRFSPSTSKSDQHVTLYNFNPKS